MSTTSSTPKAVTKPLEFLDERLGLAKLLKGQLRKVFPDHWSFLLGEIALYSFIILLLSGTFLTLWFKPSMQEVMYDGSYGPLQGVHMSEAFASTLDISFDVRGGLLMRQIHHWAAMLFIAAMTVHMLRVFFTGAFRKPRELNWLLGTILLQLGLIEGFTGYSLPDDLLSGTGLRFVEGLIRSLPVVGTYVSFFIFGGEFPGDAIIPRLYGIHILLLPGLILALIAAHIGLVVYHKHTQYPGPGRTNNNVVGYPLLPVYMAKAGGFFFIVFGVTALMGAILQLNPVWLYGPYNPSQVGAGTQPDWYMGWVEGGLRIMPNWETHIAGFTISWNIVIPGFGLLGLLAVVLAIYPFLERWVTGDTREHHVLDRPRNQPTRTAFGVGGHHVLRPALGRWRQRHHRDHVQCRAQRHHVVPTLRDLHRAGDRVHDHEADLCRAPAPRPRHAAARHGDGHHHAAAQRRVHRGAQADQPRTTPSSSPRTSGRHRSRSARVSTPTACRPPTAGCCACGPWPHASTSVTPCRSQRTRNSSPRTTTTTTTVRRRSPMTAATGPRPSGSRRAGTRT